MLTWIWEIWCTCLVVCDLNFVGFNPAGSFVSLDYEPWTLSLWGCWIVRTKWTPPKKKANKNIQYYVEEWPLTCWQGCFSPGCKYSDAGEESWHYIVGMAAIWPPLCNTMPGNMTEKFVFLVSWFPGFYQIFVIGLRGNSLIVHLLYLWQSVGNTSWPACSLLHYFVGHCKGLAALVTECSCSWLSSLQPFFFPNILYFTISLLLYSVKWKTRTGERTPVTAPAAEVSTFSSRSERELSSCERGGSNRPSPRLAETHLCTWSRILFLFFTFLFLHEHTITLALFLIRHAINEILYNKTLFN